MKKLIKNYAFSALDKTIIFKDYSLIDLSSILLITNTTDNIFIYNFADPLSGGSVIGNILTLDYDTTLMSDTDALQIYYDDGSNPLTIEDIKDNAINVQIMENAEDILFKSSGSENKAFLQDEEGLQIIRDLTIEELLGNDRLVNSGRVKVEAGGQTATYYGKIGSLGEEFSVDCKGMSSVSVQALGTWTATLIPEVSINNSDWGLNTLSIMGNVIAGQVGQLSSTNIHRGSVAGVSRFRIRCSAFTSGVALIVIHLSSVPYSFSEMAVHAMGSQNSSISQKVSTLELATMDSNILSSFDPQAEAPRVAPVAPTIPATYVNNFLGMKPQILPEVRVRIVGSERLPFAQQANSNEMKVLNDVEDRHLERLYLSMVDDEGISLLKIISEQLKQLNDNIIKLTPPQ